MQAQVVEGGYAGEKRWQVAKDTADWVGAAGRA